MINGTVHQLDWLLMNVQLNELNSRISTPKQQVLQMLAGFRKCRQQQFRNENTEEISYMG